MFLLTEKNPISSNAERRYKVLFFFFHVPACLKTGFWVGSICQRGFESQILLLLTVHRITTYKL